MNGRVLDKSNAVIQWKIKLLAPDLVSMAHGDLMIARARRIFRRARLPHIRGRQQFRFAEEVSRRWARPILFLLKEDQVRVPLIRKLMEVTKIWAGLKRPRR
eukprot:9446879-Pyramimonas_sp.AAC.1